MNSTATRYTIRELSDFCIKHRGTKAFKDWTYLQIAKVLYDATLTGNLAIVDDESGICGICVYSMCSNEVHVSYLVAVRNGFKTLIVEARKQHPTLPVTGIRRGKFKTFKHTDLWTVVTPQT